MAPSAARSETALLVIDVQNLVVATAHERDAVVANIGTLVESARVSAVPVIWVQHDDAGLPVDTEGWQIVPELVPAATEPIVRKNVRDAFESTDLEQQLADRHVGRLVVAGAQTDFCVRWTLHSALVRGYDTVLVADGHTTDAESPVGLPTGAELIAHTNSIWASQAHPDYATSVLPTAEIAFG